MSLIGTLRSSRRLGAGVVLAFVGVVNLAANGLWLRTGDVHRPNLHVTMRGGRFGFWLSTILAGATLLIGLVLLGLEWRARRRSPPSLGRAER